MATEQGKTKTYNVLVKDGRMMKVMADEAELDSYWLTFSKGEEIVARVARDELVGWQDQDTIPLPGRL